MRRYFIHSIYIETFSIILFVRTLRTLAVSLLVQKLLKAAHRVAQASQLALLPAHDPQRNEYTRGKYRHRCRQVPYKYRHILRAAVAEDIRHEHIHQQAEHIDIYGDGHDSLHAHVAHNGSGVLHNTLVETSGRGGI